MKGDEEFVLDLADMPDTVPLEWIEDDAQQQREEWQADRELAEAEDQTSRPNNTKIAVSPETPAAIAESGPEVLMRARARFRIFDRLDLDVLPAADEVIAGILPARGGLAVLAGAFGLGKSYISLDMSGAISTRNIDSWYFDDHEVGTHGDVLYIAREGFHGVPDRVRAWEAHNSHPLDNVKWLPDAIDLKKPADARDLALLAADLGVVMIVTDSVRATGSGKEDTDDMGSYVKGLETLTNAGFSVLAPHNTGWDATRPRGSTLLPDAADTILILEGNRGPNDIRTLKHLKHRDGDMLAAGLRFRFQEVPGTGSGVLVSPVPATGSAMSSTRAAAIAKWGPKLDDYLKQVAALNPLPTSGANLRALKGWERNKATYVWREWKLRNPT